MRLRIAELDDEGAGLGLLDGTRVHVAGALPGEEIAARLVHQSPHRPEAWAELAEVLSPSNDRTVPACAAYGTCGGCVLEHMSYARQLEWKRAQLAAALERVGLSVDVPACVASPTPLGYRNKSKLVCARDERGRLILGGYVPRSHRVIDLAGCQVAAAPLEAVAATTRDLFEAHGLSTYDERSGEGLLRYVILRVNYCGQVLATWITTAAPFPAAERLAHELHLRHPEVVGIIHDINRRRDNVLYGDEERTLFGTPYVDERVGKVTLRLGSRSFFQVNRAVAERIYHDVKAAVELSPGERVVDAYAGVGGIAHTLAAAGAEVIAIEENPSAVADAERSGASGARFRLGDAADCLQEIDRADVLVFNPPRKGCAESVLSSAKRLGARTIAYVSCSPSSLARDLSRLVEEGWRLSSVSAYDMLPQTPHIETLAILRRS